MFELRKIKSGGNIMNSGSRMRNSRNFMLVLLVFSLCLPFSGYGSALQKLSLKEITDFSEVIAVGEVVTKEAKWVDRHIETTYKIKAAEYWKGNLGDNFEFTQMGGDLYKPLPVSMRAEGSPRFYEGEKVVLFLQKAKKPSFKRQQTKDKSKLWNSYKVVGWVQGKYTILEDPATGEEKAVRLGLENVRIVEKNEMAALCAAAAEQPRIKVAKSGKKIDAVKVNKLAAPKASEEQARIINMKKSLKKPENSSVQGKSLPSGSDSRTADNSLASLNLGDKQSVADLKSRVLDIVKKP
jgi:hypothetical protein